MNSELIMNSDVLDIIFENKNKDYGAYSLRKYYGSRLYKALGIMCGVVVVFAAYAFIPQKEKPAVPGIITSGPYIIPDVKKKEGKKENPEPIKKDVKIPMEKDLNNPVIAKDNETADTLSSQVITNPGNKNITGDSIDAGPFSPGNEGGRTGYDTITIPGAPLPPFDPEAIVENPEIEPSFPGGEAAFRKFLQKNLVNPREMVEGESVKVVIRFVVGHDGKLKSFDIIQDGGDEFDKEVIRVVKKMPDWKPGRSSGRAVSVYYLIPIKFIAMD